MVAVLWEFEGCDVSRRVLGYRKLALLHKDVDATGYVAEYPELPHGRG